VILSAGDPASSLFLLTQGRAKYYRATRKGEEVVLWWLGPGDSFGIGTLLIMSWRYIATAQAVDDCEMLVWRRDVIRSLAAEHELLAQNALQIVLDSLAVYTDRLVGISTGTAEERLAHTLLQLIKQIGQVRPGGVELAIMNEDLASMANVSAFTASRQLKQWERQGIVKKQRGKVSVLSPESLLID
jgi:CRP-like cAMP-binding protein